MSNLISVTGHLCNDYIITVDEFPPVGESRRVVNRENYFGGGAANIAVGIAKLGGEAELISAVGRDFPESPYERHLKEMGVKTSFFESTENCSTAFMVNTTAGDQITYFEWGAGEAFARSESPKREFIHMATGDAAYNIGVAKNAEFASLDPGQDVKYYTKEQLEELFANIGLLICNNFEIEKIPSVAVSAVDPTGAGDAYRAGLFTAWKKGFDLADACKVGAVVSSFAVEKIGTQTNLPTWDEMAARFEKAFGELPT